MGTEAEAEQVCTLSAMQQGLFFNSMLAPGSGVDMVQFVFDLPEEVEPARLLDAWQRAADRHPILRSSFHADGGGPPVLRVRFGARVPFAEHDWRGLAGGEQEARLRAWLLEDRRRGVEFDSAPLLRLNLFRMQDRLWRLVWSWHHALLDGHSVYLLVREVFATYQALGAGDSPAPPPAPSFGEYIEWARAQDTSAAEGYWRGLLAGFAEPLPLPLDHVSTLPFLAENYHEQLTHLQPETTLGLRALAREHGLTPNTVVQGAWAILLARYTGTRDVVFGNIRSGRRSTLASAPEIVGPLISNVPVRVRLPEAERLIPWLQALRAQHVEVRRFEHSPLVDIQAWSEVPKGTALFQTGIVFDNSSLRARFQALGGAWEQRGLTILRQPNVPLAVGAYFDAEDRLTLRLGYYVDRLEHATAERMLGHFRLVVEQMVARPERSLGELDLMEDGERERVVHGWSRAVEGAAPEAKAHALVSAQARRTPDAVAVEDSSGARLTYAELERRADGIAHLLRERGVVAETRVAVLMERGAGAVVAFLAVLKVGGCYVPLDAELPAERLCFLLRDSGAALVLTGGGAGRRLPDGEWQALNLDDAAVPDAPPLPESVTPRNLAYLIYTSGSTGTPKGVLVEHSGLASVVRAARHLYPRTPGRYLQVVSASFDVAVFDILATLASGSTLVVAPAAARAGAPLGRLLADAAITRTAMPPSVLATIPEPAPAALRSVGVGGEACAPRLAARWSAGRRFWNLYGPTEATIWATSARVRPGQRGAVPLGRPIAGTRCYVVDAWLRPVAPGVWGELLLGGPGVARGYHRHPAATAERFVPDPFADEPGARLYRTGDRVRWNAAGMLEFGGRLDDQVKVRGLRIEPGEVEQALRGHPGVAEAVVALREHGGEPLLVGYVVAAGAAPGAEVLRAHLLERLPPHMVPGAFVTLERLPRTATGKVDRAALPQPGIGGSEKGYVAPRTPAEEALAGIWADVLEIDRVGVHDNFFELGGHSLLAMMISSRVRESLGMELPLSLLFQSPTVAQLAAELGTPRPAPSLPGLGPRSRDALRIRLPAR